MDVNPGGEPRSRLPRAEPLASLVLAGLLVVPRLLVADTVVNGSITSSTTWTPAGSPYVVTGFVDISGPSAPVLTIEPGVTVKFNGAQGMAIGEQGPGGLMAVGTVEQPIRFTSNTAAPVEGHWRGLYVRAQALPGTRIANAVVEGGGYYREGGVVVSGGAPVLQSVTIQKNVGSGVRVDGGTPTIRDSVLSGTTGVDALGLDVRGGTVTLRDTTITGNAGAAMALYAGAVLEGLTGLTVAGNGADVVRYRTSSITASETWKSFGLPYVPDGFVTVSGPSAPVLTIEPGVTVKFNGAQGMAIGEQGPGGLMAVGTVEQPIRFTSNTAAPVEGNWRGLYVRAQALPGTRITNAVVEGGGYFGEGGVVVSGGAPVLQSVTIQKNRGSGIRVDGGTPTISGCTITAGPDRGIWLLAGGAPRVLGSSITGNARAGIQNESSRATIRFNTVSGNGGDGLLSVNGSLGVRDNSVTTNGTPARSTDGSGRTLDARQQWWGATSPPAGLVGRVESDPWLGAPPIPLFAITSLERSTGAFNPEGAGARFSFQAPSPASWTLTFADAGGTDVRAFAGSGVASSIFWNGRDSEGRALPDGTYSYRLTAVETATSIAAAPLLGRVVLDRTLPLAALTAPEPGGVVASPITVAGTATGTAFTEYVLEYGAGDFPSAWTTIDLGSVAVTEGTLGLWSSVLTDPLYTLRLTVKAGGKTAVEQLTVRPAGQTVCP